MNVIQPSKPTWSIPRRLHGLGITVMILWSGMAWAAPINGVFTYAQPDGSTLPVRVVGDEFFAEERTLDGRRIIQDPVSNYWCYAQLSEDGNALESTGIVATESAPTEPVPKHLRIQTPRKQRMRIVQANRERFGRDGKGRIILPQAPAETDLTRDEATSQKGSRMVLGGATLGRRNGLTLLIEFPQLLNEATLTREQVDHFCNQMSPHYTEFGNNGSVAEFYNKVSNGKLTYTNTVVAYHTAKHTRDYYTDASVAQGIRAGELIVEALSALEAANFDFRSVDQNGDGIIDAVNCLYAGPIVNTWGKGLWPHASLMFWVSPKTGKLAALYQITNMGDALDLATFCHENGHMVCHFPDVYDYDQYTTPIDLKDDSKGGAGVFCLMDGGGIGNNPSPPNGYLRYKAGWGTAETITAATYATKTLTAQSNGRLANEFLIYVNPTNPFEYFLIENYTKENPNSAAPTRGIAIWHVDEWGNHNNQSSTHQSKHANYEVALIQADNQRHFERNINNGEANDLFFTGNSAPTYSNQFSDTSDPSSFDNNAHWWNGKPSGLKLSGFSVPGNRMSLVVGQPITFNEVESNANLFMANVVPNTTTKIVGTIGSTADQDWFKVVVDAGRTLTLTLTGPTNKNYDVYLYNIFGIPLTKSIGSTATESITYQNPYIWPVTYCIQVLGNKGSCSATTPYNLILSR